MINRIISCFALSPIVALAQDITPLGADDQATQKLDALWQPILPPTSGDGADALDRRVYSDFANDEAHIANEPGSSKSYAILPHFAAANYYDDNISLSDTNRQSALVFALEPGMAFGLGDFRAEQSNFLIADYTGRWASYLNHQSADAYEQFATVRAQLALARWKFNTNFRFLDLNDVDIDSGTRTWRLIYETAQVATYELSEKDFLELQGENVIRDYQTGPGSVEWQGRGLYNYRLDPKLTLGGGFAVGTLDVEDSERQNYEQGLLRALYEATEKCSVQIQGGLELRQLGSGEDKLTPVMELNAEYRPQSATTIDLTGYCRNLSSSVSGDLDYTATGVGLSVAHEFGFSWLAILKGGYENNSYFYADIRAASPREDNFIYVNPTIQFRFNDHAKIELFYNFRKNESDNQDRAFTDNQIGIRASFSY